MDERHLLAEGLSRGILDETGLDGPPIDLDAIAAHLALKTSPGAFSAVTSETVIFDESLETPRRRAAIAHELGHALARHHGEDDRDEQLAWSLGAALLVPSASLKADLAERCWDLAGLPERYDVSWELLVRRLCHVVGAVVSCWDNGRMTRRWRSPWLSSSGFSRRRSRVPLWEEELAAECTTTEWHLYEEDGVAAYFVESPGWRRVFVVSEVEAWEGRERSVSRPSWAC